MTQAEEPKGRRDFVKYSFFKVSPDWRQLPQERREQDKREFAEVIGEFSDRVTMASYSLVGTRGDVDLMLWKICPELDPIDRMLSQLNRTGLAGYLTMPHSYLAMTRPSPYEDQHRYFEHEGTAATMRIVGRKFLFVYPFVKTTTGTSCPWNTGSA